MMNTNKLLQKRDFKNTAFCLKIHRFFSGGYNSKQNSDNNNSTKMCKKRGHKLESAIN